jgi:hypothetical protein
MKLIEFEPLDVSKIPLRAPKTKEERAKEISKMIVNLTRIAQPIHISYLVGSDTDESEISDEESTNDTGSLDSSASWTEGAAVKRKSATWGVALSNGFELTLPSNEMLTSPNVFVQNACLELDSTERKGTFSKKKRIRVTEKRRKEKEHIELAREKQDEEDLKEFDSMNAARDSGNFSFSQFKDVLARAQEPFSCDIDGVNIHVTADDAAVMFDRATLLAMNSVLAIGGGNKNGPRRRRDETLLLRRLVLVLAATKRTTKRTVGIVRRMRMR